MSSSKASFILLIFSIIGLATILTEPCHAIESSAEQYWKAKLGDTPIPTVLKSSLPLGSNDESVIGKNSNYEASSYIQDFILPIFYKNTYDGPDSDIQDFILPIFYKKVDSVANIDVHDHIPIFYKVDSEANFDVQDHIPIFYKNKISKSEIPQGVIIFTDDVFSEEGTKLKLQFGKIDTKTKFLPLNMAKSLPVSSNKLQVILSMLSVNPSSSLAQDISNTIKECEAKGVKNEVRFCANSLEAMVDNVIIALNSGKNNVKIYSTDVGENSNLQEFTVKKATKIENDEDKVVCHKLKNPYAVFLCHNIKSTDAYVVSLVGANGQEVKALGVCHTDTSAWDPEILAFKVLKIKPGSKPVCHFLHSEALLWVQDK